MTVLVMTWLVWTRRASENCPRASVQRKTGQLRYGFRVARFAGSALITLQRAFRQRKEGYIKKLEEQVKEFQSMEQSYRALQHENYQLREYILNLQSRLLESSSDFPPAPSHINLASSAAAAAVNTHIEHSSATEHQLRRELQHSNTQVPLPPAVQEPPRPAPIDHLGAAAARAVELEARRPQESPYGLGAAPATARMQQEVGDATMVDAKSR
jgi:hypothetical protein